MKRLEESIRNSAVRKSALKKVLSKNGPRMAVLIDPDKFPQNEGRSKFLKSCAENGVDLFLVGGSLITSDGLRSTLSFIRTNSTLPILLFPSNPSQIDDLADGILFLSLISGRQADYLIGHHVVAAPILARIDMEVIPTGYMLIDGGKTTTAHYMSNSMPIPSDKTEIAIATAMAGCYLGHEIIYLDAGSGADRPVPPDMISAVRESIDKTLMVGGGIRTTVAARGAIEAGADIVVIGNGLEESPGLLQDLSIAIHAGTRLSKD